MKKLLLLMFTLFFAVTAQAYARNNADPGRAVKKEDIKTRADGQKAISKEKRDEVKEKKKERRQRIKERRRVRRDAARQRRVARKRI